MQQLTILKDRDKVEKYHSVEQGVVFLRDGCDGSRGPAVLIQIDIDT